jgi:hypothetical protein
MGIADMDGSFAMAQELKNVMRKDRITKALIDHRNIESVQGGTFDIYDRPGIMKVIGLIIKIRIAEIVKPDHIQHFRFLETAFLNQGFMLRVFQEKEKARMWLFE